MCRLTFYQGKDATLGGYSQFREFPARFFKIPWKSAGGILRKPTADQRLWARFQDSKIPHISFLSNTQRNTLQASTLIRTAIKNLFFPGDSRCTIWLHSGTLPVRSLGLVFDSEKPNYAGWFSIRPTTQTVPYLIVLGKHNKVTPYYVYFCKMNELFDRLAIRTTMVLTLANGPGGRLVGLRGTCW